jgi:hypothetical protein
MKIAGTLVHLTGDMAQPVLTDAAPGKLLFSRLYSLVCSESFILKELPAETRKIFSRSLRPWAELPASA